MPSTGLFTTEDLDEIGFSFSEQPFEVAAELVDAVDRGLVADQADTGFALMLAAEIVNRAGDLQTAQVLAGRAVQAYRVHGDPDCYSQAFHAELLLRLGREDEGMAELAALRPLLSEDAGAVSYISEALERGGHPEIAEQWLTAALDAALQRRQELGSQRGKPAYEQATSLASGLAGERHRVRRDLGLPRDEHDCLAAVLRDEVLGSDKLDYEGTGVLFWPRPEFDRLLLRWPALAEEYGQTWDEYLITVQRSLVLWSESGYPRMALFSGAVDQLAHYADREGSDPTDPQTHQGYAQYLAEHSR